MEKKTKEKRSRNDSKVKCHRDPQRFHVFSSLKSEFLPLAFAEDPGPTNNVLFVKIEGPVTGIPSIIIYLLFLGGKPSNP